MFHTLTGPFFASPGRAFEFQEVSGCGPSGDRGFDIYA